MISPLTAQVGYKYRFFGEDAHIASSVLGTYTYTKQNYVISQIPTHKIGVTVKRLVAAGHKVFIHLHDTCCYLSLISLCVHNFS
jgi:DNA mismatch repair ATPase MutS